MSIRFVKTSILASEDGIDFNKEISIESEEQRAARLAAESAAQRPLYQQLLEQKEKKQAEYDAITKQIFAPPKGLDDEEFGFISAIEEAKNRKEKSWKDEEAKALEEFRLASKYNHSEENTVKRPTVAIVTEKQTPPPTIVPQIKIVKRKIEKSEKSSAVDSSQPVEKKVKTSTQAVAEEKTKQAATIHKDDSSNTHSATIGDASLSLLCDYGSDDEEEDSSA